MSSRDLRPKRRENEVNVPVLNRDIIYQKNITSDFLIQYPASGCCIKIIVFVVAWNPICGFKMVGNLFEKILVFIHHCKRHNIASQN
jgi:hypothetical protein